MREDLDIHHISSGLVSVKPPALYGAQRATKYRLVWCDAYFLKSLRMIKTVNRSILLSGGLDPASTALSMADEIFSSDRLLVGGRRLF